METTRSNPVILLNSEQREQTRRACALNDRMRLDNDLWHCWLGRRDPRTRATCTGRASSRLTHNSVQSKARRICSCKTGVARHTSCITGWQYQGVSMGLFTAPFVGVPTSRPDNGIRTTGKPRCLHSGNSTAAIPTHCATGEHG